MFPTPLLLLLQLDELLSSFSTEAASVSVSVSGNGPDAHINAGDDVSLVCTVSGTSLHVVEYQWSKESGSMPPSSRLFGIDNEMLVLRDTTTFDSGTYRCQVTLSNAQHFKGTGSVLVMDTPVIKNHADVTVRAFTDTFLKCSGTGYSRIFWYKNGRLLNTDSRFRTDTQVGEKLIVNNVSLSDAGTYKCQAKNSAGGHVMKTVLLVVETIPKVMVHPDDIRVQKGLDALFACNVSGIPVPGITWKSGSLRKQIDTSDPKYEIDNSRNERSTLLIKKVQKADENVYICVALNTHGSVESKEAHLAVGNLEPGALGIVAYKSVSHGSNDSITCSAEGFSSSSITWTFNGGDLKSISSTDVYQKKNGELIINNAVYKYTGEYKCTIVILYLSAEVTLVQTVHVTVRGRPGPPYLVDASISFSDVNQTLHGLVRWNSPLFDGHSHLIGYKMYWRAIQRGVGQFPWANKAVMTPPRLVNLSDLVDLTYYLRYIPGNFTFEFTVKGINAYGDSPWSNVAVGRYYFESNGTVPPVTASVTYAPKSNDKKSLLIPTGFVVFVILVAVVTAMCKRKRNAKFRSKRLDSIKTNITLSDNVEVASHGSLSSRPLKCGSPCLEEQGHTKGAESVSQFVEVILQQTGKIYSSEESIP
eukprot:m.137672 g.137672  ORF g.137672 m.137672 type:complete len:645 (+) comp38225_c0_seq1:104-2038(+)